MDLDKLVEKLNKYQFKNKIDNKKITVKLGISQEVSIDFSDGEKVLIKDKLVAWNPLTGIINMSLKQTMIYNSIGLLLTFILFGFLSMNNPMNNILFLLIIFLFWITLWTVYYLIKSENFKRQVIDWIDN